MYSVLVFSTHKLAARSQPGWPGLLLPELLGAATSMGSSTRAKGSSGKDGSDSL